jgi:hypothetical protein
MLVMMTENHVCFRLSIKENLIINVLIMIEIIIGVLQLIIMISTKNGDFVYVNIITYYQWIMAFKFKLLLI